MHPNTIPSRTEPTAKTTKHDHLHELNPTSSVLHSLTILAQKACFATNHALSAWISRSVVYSVAFIQVLAAADAGVTAGPVGSVRGLNALASCKSTQGLNRYGHR